MANLTFSPSIFVIHPFQPVCTFLNIGFMLMYFKQLGSEIYNIYYKAYCSTEPVE